MTLTVLNISGRLHSIAVNDTSGSGDPCCPLDTPLTRGTKTAAYVILMLLAFVGNVLVVHIVRRNPTLRSTVDRLVVNMCVSDLFMPIFPIPYHIEMIYAGSEWINGDLGSFLCKLVPFAINVTTEVSILSMLAIAVERFRAVVYPTKPTLFTGSSCRRLISLIWVLSILTHCVHLYTFVTQVTGTKTYCVRSWYQDEARNFKAEKIYFTSVIVLQVAVIPMILITVLYTAVVATLRQQNTRMASHLASEPLRKRAKRNRKITFMLTTVVVVFALGYIPLSVSGFLLFYNPRTLGKLCSYLFSFVFLFYVPSAINPVIYLTFNDRYRHGLRNLFCSDTICQSCPGCPVSPTQDQGNNACAFAVHVVDRAFEMQEPEG